uniref:Uncharacterized protein n=1 Tax=Oryza brachyantha TaxID=4533 RepID=J3LDR8_ORYBR
MNDDTVGAVVVERVDRAIDRKDCPKSSLLWLRLLQSDLEPDPRRAVRCGPQLLARALDDLDSIGDDAWRNGVGIGSSKGELPPPVLESGVCTEDGGVLEREQTPLYTEDGGVLEREQTPLYTEDGGVLEREQTPLYTEDGGVLEREQTPLHLRAAVRAVCSIRASTTSSTGSPALTPSSSVSRATPPVVAAPRPPLGSRYVAPQQRRQWKWRPVGRGVGKVKIGGKKMNLMSGSHVQMGREIENMNGSNFINLSGTTTNRRIVKIFI